MFDLAFMSLLSSLLLIMFASLISFFFFFLFFGACMFQALRRVVTFLYVAFAFPFKS